MDDNDDRKPIPPNAGGIDQFGAIAVSMSEVVSEYYKALIGNGVNEELARELTRSFHEMIWRKLSG